MAGDGEEQALRGRDLLGLGAMLVGAVVGWTLVGLVVDHYAGTSPAGVIGGVALGIVSGATGFVVRVRQALRDSG